MNTEHLRYFLITAKNGSMGKAANALHLKQQYLSNVIKSLEQQFGTKLFIRQAKGVTLTEDGQYFADKAARIIALCDELQLGYLYPSQAQERHVTLQVTIYTIPHVVSRHINEIVATFHQLFPNVTFKIKEVIFADEAEVIKADPYALILAPQQSYEKIAPDETFFSIPYHTEEVIAMTSQRNNEAEGLSSITLKELSQKPLVVFAPKGEDKSLLYRLLSEYEGALSMTEVENTALFSYLISQSTYYAVGHRDFARANNLRIMPFNPPIYLQLVLAVRKEALNNFAIKSFVDTFLAHWGLKPL